MSGNETPAPARGDAAREALLRAALAEFAKVGFHAAGTRDIARAAGINQALIGYHFGGKQGLYLAVFAHIGEQVAGRMGPIAQSVQTRLATVAPRGRSAQAARGEALEMLCELLQGLLAMLADEASAPWAQLIIREQQAPSEAFDLLYEGFMSRMMGLMTRLVQRIRPHEDEAAARLRVVMLYGQLLVFRAARAAALRHLGWRRVGPREIDLIQRQLRAQVGALLLAKDET